MLKVAVFDEEHEKDLQHEINEFLKKLSEDQLVDIKYDVSAACDPQAAKHRHPGRTAVLSRRDSHDCIVI